MANSCIQILSIEKELKQVLLLEKRERHCPQNASLWMVNSCSRLFLANSRAIVYLVLVSRKHDHCGPSLRNLNRSLDVMVQNGSKSFRMSLIAGLISTLLKAMSIRRARNLYDRKEVVNLHLSILEKIKFPPRSILQMIMNLSLLLK